MQNGTWRAMAFSAAVVSGAVGFALVGGPPRPGAWPRTLVLAGPNYALLRRMDAKAWATREVIAGRLSLWQAAAAFKALDAEAPPYPGWVFVPPPPGMTEEEGYCRSVIDWVRWAAPADRADELVGRLQAQLDAGLRQGTPHLPDPSVGRDCSGED